MYIQSYICAAYLRRHVWCEKQAELLYFPINIDESFGQQVAFAQTTSVVFASSFPLIDFEFFVGKTKPYFGSIL